MSRCLFALALVLAGCSFARAEDADDGWIALSDGKSFEGWKINEHETSWALEDGAFKANGERSHLFYVGDVKPFVNFEFECEVMTRPGSNGGIYFHTEYQDEGWPAVGHECQVNNTQGDPQKTGGIYNTVRVTEAPAKDDVWFKYSIRVDGKHVVVKIDDKVVVDYTEPEGMAGPVKLGAGTFALQAHDPGSTVYFRNLRVKRLE